MKKKIIKKTPLGILGNLLVYGYALLLIAPIYFAIITAFKTEPERILNPIGLPESWGFQNFVKAWVEGKMARASVNSVIISCATTVLNLLNVILVSFCLNRIRNTKIGTALYMLILSAMFIPGVGTASLLQLRRDLGLYNNLYGEIIVGSIGLTMGVFLASGFLRTIPPDLEEAAMLDGAGDMQICFQVIVPVIRPVLTTVGILTFRECWNNTLGPLLTLRNEKLYTIPMALYLNFNKEYSVEYTTMFAGVIMTAIPMIIIYCKCQKYFVTALAGSVKG